MTPARFHTIEEIYCAALDQEPETISAFLNTACEGDAVLRREVEALLVSRERVGSFIETPAAGLARRIIQNGQDDLLVGQTFGHYKILNRIGSGGMGEVYLATDITAGRKAALKLLPMCFTGDAERLKRFQQEARAVVGLNHPNILTVYEIGEDHSTHYIASELIEGETLRERLGRGPMQVTEAVEIAIQMASALLAAHEAGVVHRDIKPENIMLRPDGYVKVLDFGIAKLAESAFAEATGDGAGSVTLAQTNLGSILGTVRYMSPEQACPDVVGIDKRSDIWSLGVVLYEMVAGHAPFTGDTPGDVMSAIIEKEPPSLTRYVARAPVELLHIVSKTLRKDPNERYRSAHELLNALKGVRRKLEFEAELKRSTAKARWLRSTRPRIAISFVLLTVAVPLALSFFWNHNVTTSSAQKSIAVLPFENLSKGEESGFFAGGVQDEILTNLAKVADLKVISRTSVMKYKSDLERNLREIAKTLGVSHVVEGSVQRDGERIRVNVQLIDARTDGHLWAEHYDRDAADIFAIQSEIAQHIANQLRARLSAAERAAIAERPTSDLAAYALYAEAKGIRWQDWEGADSALERQVGLLEKATQRDPNFALAYAFLAGAQLDLFQATGGGRSESSQRHLESGKEAAEAASQLRPDLGEAHLALAKYYYLANLQTGDFNRVSSELAVARRTLPNDSEAMCLAARIDKRRQHWDDSLANFRKAKDLDPGNAEVAYYHRLTLFEMRRYQEFEQALAKDLETGATKEPRNQLDLAELKLAQGDPIAAQALLAQVPLEFSATDWVWRVRFMAALYLRDYDGASRVIAATPGKFAYIHDGQTPDSWADALVARARGDMQRALAVFAATRTQIEATWGDKRKDAQYFADVARLDAGLGRKEEAIRKARQSVDLMPISKDSYWGPNHVIDLAMVYAWTGEFDRAFEQLETVATIPNGATYGDLRFNPRWDDLRGDQRFDKIVAAAKVASK